MELGGGTKKVIGGGGRGSESEEFGGEGEGLRGKGSGDCESLRDESEWTQTLYVSRPGEQLEATRGERVTGGAKEAEGPTAGAVLSSGSLHGHWAPAGSASHPSVGYSGDDI